MSEVLARRYARAYFELAREAGDLAGWGDHLRASAAALSDPEVAAGLSNPRVGATQRAALAEEIGARTSTATGNLLRLLVERGRTGLLPGIVAAYARLADRAGGVIRAEVTAAVAVDHSLRETVRQTLGERLGREVHTEVVQDPAILGGLVVRVGERVIDNSLRTHLQQLRAALA